VIGDSYASGYGVEGADRSCTSSYANQNSDLAFPALTAKAFGADVHVVAADGRGLTRNFAGDAPTMATLAWQTLADSDTAWDTTAFDPQVIVLNLGTNDFTASDPGASFDEAYVYTLRKLRAAYPKATVMGAIGGSLWRKRYDAAKTSISDAVKLLNKEGDTNVKFVEFTPTAGQGRYGCDSHPGVRAQAQMAATLQAAIEASVGWKPAE
jgi:lysophospholipase L1-like esterase